MKKEEIKTLKEIKNYLFEKGCDVYYHQLNAIINRYDRLDLLKRKELFIIEVESKKEYRQYDKILIKEFIEYWTEHGEKDRKMRFEKQTSFDISRRLKTWQKRSQQYSSKPNSKSINGIWNR